jgi:hypothetical protein
MLKSLYPYEYFITKKKYKEIKKNSKKKTWFNLIIKALIKNLARIYDIVSVILLV